MLEGFGVGTILAHSYFKKSQFFIYIFYFISFAHNTKITTGIVHELTEVIFKYVVVMKPTKLGIWFKLGF